MDLKKILSAVTALAMSIGISGVSVFAEENVLNGADDINVSDTVNEEDLSFSYEKKSFVDSGGCGANRSSSRDEFNRFMGKGYFTNICWEFYDDGMLRIFGMGDMQDYSFDSLPDYVEKYRTQIKKVYFDGCVERIGEYAFYDLPNLQEVIFNSHTSVKNIGKGAFNGCARLDNVMLPNSCKSIGASAFYGCTSLTYLRLPGNAGMADAAFGNCPNLTHIDIPEDREASYYNPALSALPTDTSLYHTYNSDGVCSTENCPLNTEHLDDVAIMVHKNFITYELKGIDNDYGGYYYYDVNFGDGAVNICSSKGKELTEGIDYTVVNVTTMYGNNCTDSAAKMEKSGIDICIKSGSIKYDFITYKKVKEGVNQVYANGVSENGYTPGEVSNNIPEKGETFTISAPVKPDYSFKEWTFEQSFVGSDYPDSSIIITDKYSPTTTVVINNTNARVGFKATYTAADSSLCEDFVERLYTKMLDRPSEEEGKRNWVNSLKNGVSATDVASGFVLSEEIRVKNLSNAEFVKRMYRTFMDREPDANGLADWVNALDNGCSYAYILNSFASSTEFKNICAVYGIYTGSYELTEARDKSRNLTAFTSRMYTKALGRAYEVEGLNYWTGRYINGEITLDDMAYGFIFSAEFANKNLDNEQYIDTLYATFFDRPADAAGKADWLNRIYNQGYSREQVLDGFLGAEEFANLVKSFDL